MDCSDALSRCRSRERRLNNDLWSAAYRYAYAAQYEMQSSVTAVASNCVLLPSVPDFDVLSVYWSVLRVHKILLVHHEIVLISHLCQLSVAAQGVWDHPCSRQDETQNFRNQHGARLVFDLRKGIVLHTYFTSVFNSSNLPWVQCCTNCGDWRKTHQLVNSSL